MFGLCSHDPIVDTLRSVFHANIVAIPEERIQPLSLIAKIGDSKTSFRGALSAALKQPTHYSDPPVHQSTMANVSGTKSRQVDAKIGLQILGNFLSGFGVPPIGINTAFSGATKVSFSFNKVVRFWVDDDVVGSELTGSVLDQSNAGAAIFFQQGYKCFILDSTITSSDFTISVDQSSSGNFQIQVPAIQQIVQNANANVSVASSSSTSISFTGQKQLAFAFSCVSAQLDSEGRILALQPGTDLPPVEGILSLNASASSGEIFAHRPARVLLTRIPVMLDTEFLK